MAVFLMLYINGWRVPFKERMTMCFLGVTGIALCGGAAGMLLNTILPVPDTISGNIAFYVIMSYVLSVACILCQYVLWGKFFRPAVQIEKTNDTESEHSEQDVQ